jgi:hypothetical protein
MKWHRETEWNIVSDCKRFRICKSVSATPEQKALGEYVYLAFKRGEVIRAGTLEECKEACK